MSEKRPMSDDKHACPDCGRAVIVRGADDNDTHYFCPFCHWWGYELAPDSEALRQRQREDDYPYPPDTGERESY